MKNSINGLRFIVGSGCNYKCFYCHHEGYTNKDAVIFDEDKLDMLYKYAIKNNITNISITGGEPFLYWPRLKNILKKFDDNRFKITLNTNLLLISKYIEEIAEFNPIEFHVNLSSLSKEKHEQIIGYKYLDQVLNNLQLLKNTNHIICLNIPVLKEYNDKEITDIYKYAKQNKIKPRFLVLLPMTEKQKKVVMDVDEILNIFPGAKVIKKYDYGIYDIMFGEETFEIVKCLCIDMECQLCKKYTYMHITPELNIKYCMKNTDEVIVDYSTLATVEKSFIEAQKRLELV